MNKGNCVHHPQELDLIHGIARTSLDEFTTTILLAHTLAENAIRAISYAKLEPTKDPFNKQEEERWNAYTDKISKILDQYGTNLQEILNQKLGQEVIEEMVGKYKAKINSLKERRQ